ncbi:MAG: polyprenyl synthetase family protein [Bacteroidia bacterium]
MNENPYKKLTEAFDDYFTAIVKLIPQHPKNLYQPVTYFLGLDAKRIRPLLALIAADCFGAKTTKALPAAAAVELFHNFSLIHDDIMDNAPLRRGKQTVHEKWNKNIAILSGDVLLVKAYQELAKCKKETSMQLQSVFSTTAIGLCEGQQLDMDFETRTQVSIEEYMEMIRLKTAVLLGSSMQMGAICANPATEGAKKDAELFYRAGEKLGVAFQLTDDYLDVFGATEKVGKQVGGDIIANKKTWLLLKALETSKASQKKELQSWITKKQFNPKEKIAAVKEIFISLNLNSHLQKQIDSYYHQAIKLLQTSSASKKKIEVFAFFAQNLMQRVK